MLEKVRSIENQLAILAVRVKEADKRALAQQDCLQTELDGYIAADCPLCGFAMIKSLAVSLVSDSDFNEAKSWEI